MILFCLILNFIYSFEIVNQSQNTQSCENKEVTLFVLANDENLNYKWFKDGILIENSNSPALLLNKVKFENAGNYTCEVSNNSSTILSKTINLNIIPATEIVNKSNTISSFNQSLVHLFCELSDNSKNLYNKIQWYDSKWNPLVNNDTIEGVNSNLLSIQIDSTKTHKLYCIVDGDCNSDTATFNINYFQTKLPAKIIKTVCEDSLINFVFEITEKNNLSFPKVINSRIYNQKNETIKHNVIQENHKIKLQLDEPMKKNKTGKYLCELTFPNKTIQFDLLELSIYEKTRLISKSEDYIELKSGQDLNLNITASGNIQEYIWYKNDSLVYQSKFPNYQKMQITKQDEGIYSCKVVNFCQDSIFFISELIVDDNSIYLSVSDIQQNKSKIIAIYDALGRTYPNDIYNLKNNNLYFVLLSNNKRSELYKFIKYE